MLTVLFSHPGMQVIEWNGIPLTGISHDEVSRIIENQIGDEIEVVIRTDINLLSDQYGYSEQMPSIVPGYGPNPNHPSYDQSSYGYGLESTIPSSGLPSGGSYYGSQHAPISGPGGYQGGFQSGQPSAASHLMSTPYLPGPLQSSQPQVILQHNHPVEDGLVYDSYGTKMIPPLPTSHNQHQHGVTMIPQQQLQQPHSSQMTPGALGHPHHHPTIESPYYSQ